MAQVATIKDFNPKISAHDVSYLHDRCAAMERWHRIAKTAVERGDGDRERLTAEHRTRDYFDLVERALPIEMRRKHNPFDSRNGWRNDREPA